MVSAARPLPVSAVPGRPWLWTGLGLSLLGLLGICGYQPKLLLWIPVLLLGLLIGGLLFTRYRAYNLYVVLAGFVIILDYTEGLEIQEVLYGLYFLAFAAHWFGMRLLVYREPIAPDPASRALLYFLFYAVGSSAWSLLFFEARTRDLVGELFAVSVLVLYFPIREACERDARAVRRLLWIGVGIGLYVVGRNLLLYREALGSAIYVWEITTGRVPLNEILLLMPALMTLVLLLHARAWLHRLGLAVLFLGYFGGLILTQSRGYWAAFLVGVLLLFPLLDARKRLSVALLTLVSIGGGFLLGVLFFPNVVDLVQVGVISRFSSLGNAFTSDLSMVNRLYESVALWERIRVNPILGYGTAAPFHFFDLTFDATRRDPFTHNAYLGLWFKYGLVGLGLMLFFWVQVIRTGFQLLRQPHTPAFLRSLGLAVIVCLSAEALVANTSTPFLITDGNLVFALLGGLVMGTAARTRPGPSLQPLETRWLPG